MKPKTGNSFKADAVNAARELFLARGVENTSMDDVAAALKVSKPTVYDHFPSKQALLTEVFAAATRDVDIDWITFASDTKMPFRDFLLATSRMCIAFVSTPKRVEAYQLVVREGPHSETLRTAFADHVGRPTVIAMRKLIKAAIERGECRDIDVTVIHRLVAAPMYFAMTQRAIFGQDSMTLEELTNYFDESYRVLIDSLCLKSS